MEIFLNLFYAIVENEIFQEIIHRAVINVVEALYIRQQRDPIIRRKIMITMFNIVVIILFYKIICTRFNIFIIHFRT